MQLASTTGYRSGLKIKVPFSIETVLARIARAVAPYPPAALFELRDRGYGAPFEQLLACMISIRTLDEVTVPTALALFARARTPEQILRLGARGLDRLIRASTFHTAKVRQIQAIAARVVEEFNGKLPCNLEALLSLPGVGPKTAHLVLGIACDQPRVGVDIHVHRITNRWGYVKTTRPEATVVALEARLPMKYWVEINRLLVPFGKHICTGRAPYCSKCPVLSMCRQVGVTESR